MPKVKGHRGKTTQNVSHNHTQHNTDSQKRQKSQAIPWAKNPSLTASAIQYLDKNPLLCIKLFPGGSGFSQATNQKGNSTKTKMFAELAEYIFTQPGVDKGIKVAYQAHKSRYAAATRLYTTYKYERLRNMKGQSTIEQIQAKWPFWNDLHRLWGDLQNDDSSNHADQDSSEEDISGITSGSDYADSNSADNISCSEVQLLSPRHTNLQIANTNSQQKMHMELKTTPSQWQKYESEQCYDNGNKAHGGMTQHEYELEMKRLEVEQVRQVTKLKKMELDIKRTEMQAKRDETFLVAIKMHSSNGLTKGGDYGGSFQGLGYKMGFKRGHTMEMGAESSNQLALQSSYTISDMGGLSSLAASEFSPMYSLNNSHLPLADRI
ncbi:hypothetical protein GG344DRAFT_82646 [Lentinula edodes]|nr:hypothetical protein GG344DRAFT_82646 [Lentinula edodes]